jgi:hypothetical protein
VGWPGKNLFNQNTASHRDSAFLMCVGLPAGGPPRRMIFLLFLFFVSRQKKRKTAKDLFFSRQRK